MSECLRMKEIEREETKKSDLRLCLAITPFPSRQTEP